MTRDDAVRAAAVAACLKALRGITPETTDEAFVSALVDAAAPHLTADLVRERDEACRDAQEWMRRAEAAEAEVERLREQNDGLYQATLLLNARAERAEAAEAALREISEWDMLNPPQTDLVSDLAWLRAVVDRGLGGAS